MIKKNNCNVTLPTVWSVSAKSDYGILVASPSYQKRPFPIFHLTSKFDRSLFPFSGASDRSRSALSSDAKIVPFRVVLLHGRKTIFYRMLLQVSYICKNTIVLILNVFIKNLTNIKFCGFTGNTLNNNNNLNSNNHVEVIYVDYDRFDFDQAQSNFSAAAFSFIAYPSPSFWGQAFLDQIREAVGLKSGFLFQSLKSGLCRVGSFRVCWVVDQNRWMSADFGNITVFDGKY